MVVFFPPLWKAGAEEQELMHNEIKQQLRKGAAALQCYDCQATLGATYRHCTV